MLKIIFSLFLLILVLSIIAYYFMYYPTERNEIIPDTETERVVLATYTDRNFTITLHGVKNYQGNTQLGDPRLYSKTTFARITNTSNIPLSLTHPSGSVAGNAFRADTITDMTDPSQTVFIPSHPIDQNGVSNTTATIEPGAFYDIIGDPNHITYAVNYLVDKQLTERTLNFNYYVQFLISDNVTTTQVSQYLSAPMRITLVTSNTIPN